MNAILVIKGTQYDCNRFQIGPNMIAIIEKFVSRESNFDIAIIFGPFWKGLQSYMVRFGIEIAIIFGPLFYQNCIHIKASF